MDSEDTQRAARARQGGTPFLNTEQAAAYLSISPRLLRYLRTAGRGPVFRRHSRYVHYHIEDLDTWSREQAAREADHGAS